MQVKAREGVTSPAPMVAMTLAEYNSYPADYRTVWETERTDWKDWAQVRHKYMGKRGLQRNGALWIEGISFVIREDHETEEEALATYEVIGEGGQFLRVLGMENALRQASRLAYLPEGAKANQRERLRSQGQAIWSYGFCSVMVQPSRFPAD